jgi:hypothetical protein
VHIANIDKSHFICYINNTKLIERNTYMIGTMNCVYETPCGWCTKWDKKCNKKIDEHKYEPVECGHQWEPTSRGGGFADGYTTRTYTIWKCKICGEEKEVEDGQDL